MSSFERKTLIRDRQSTNVFATRVYGWMAIGLALTASIAFFLYQTGAYRLLMPFWWVWVIATFGIAMTINTMAQRISIGAVATLFLAYAALEGILFGTILPAFAASYGGGVIWAAFAAAGGLFALAMCYGIFTQADLTGLGTLLQLGLIGLIGLSLIYMVLSFFVHLTWAQLFISYLGLILFVGLTAYDAQAIRHFSMQADTGSGASYKLSLILALKMYVNVIMIFWYLLQIFSSSRR